MPIEASIKKKNAEALEEEPRRRKEKLISILGMLGGKKSVFEI
jgi:hypothetical protein